MLLPPVGPRHLPRRLPLTCTLALFVGLVAGCSQPPRQPDTTAPSPTVPTDPATPAPAATSSADIPDGASLTVEEVVRRATVHNPTREVFAATRAAAEAEVQIARAWANPEVEASGGRATARDGGERESIYGIELRQRFELPGKRSSRIAAARAGEMVAEREVAIDALTWEGAVREACLELAGAEATLLRMQAAQAAAEHMHRAVEQRSTAREAEAGEVARSTLDLVMARSARDRAERQVIANRAAVRVWAGGGLPEHFTISDALPTTLPAIDRQAALAAAAARNPRLGLLRAQLDGHTADLAREQRAWQPDITVGAFSAHETDTDDLGLTLGVEVPLWNRNQGGIALADAQRRRIHAQWRAEQQLITREVDLAWQLYESRRLALGSTLNEAKVAAQAALDAQLSAFAAGESSLLAVLEARRAAQAVDEAALDAQRTAAEAWLDLGRAMGSFTPTATVPAGDQP